MGALLSTQVRHVPQEPQWLQPVPSDLQGEVHELRSGNLVLRHGAPVPGNFEVLAAGECMATGFTRPMIGYQIGSNSQWIALHSAIQNARLWRGRNTLIVEYTLRDPDGGNWLLMQQFSAGATAGAIDDVRTRISVNQPREVHFLPMFLLLPGMGSYGTAKGQGLFAGLEYLENETKQLRSRCGGHSGSPTGCRQPQDYLPADGHTGARTVCRLDMAA